MKYILTIFSLLLCGCVSTAKRDLASPVGFVLERDISWSAKPALGPMETYVVSAGTYLGARRDSEGYYLVPTTGALTVSTKNLKPTEVNGGIYLPDDPSLGINIFIYDPGMTTAASGIVMMKPPSDKMIRMRAWGPIEHVSEFKRK